MPSERPLPPQPIDDDDAPQTGVPFDPVSVPTAALMTPEGDPFRASGSSPRRHSNIASDGFPFPTTFASPTSPTSVEWNEGDHPYHSAPELEDRANVSLGNNLPIRPSSARFVEPLITPSTRRRGTRDTRTSTIDYIVPVVEGKAYTLKERLEPTIKAAEKERAKYAYRANWTGWVLNVAIGLQVLLGSLTTGLSAAATNGKSAAISTTILVASYLARARGSNEPDFSITRVKDLDRFIRECKALEMDHGDDTSHKFDQQLIEERDELERILGSTVEKTSSISDKTNRNREVEKASSHPEKLATAV
ncbi:hypothetical protein CPB84DRAFT_1842463 [Gymnopilus junonius]|uniref:SMODS and SLOG-associating 2TM effector domain-containing protein n=1 Tax=Gymnopilus junonius TaxID=109634 RepID=A0A9P5TT03_GYMJU|nr:hypothetical protein CPB84DRAFT_1842463 [Gymnopilus junonius]